MPPAPTAPARELPFSIVAVDRFIQATRDSGYRSTVSALSELVDNSIQAGAQRVQVFIEPTEGEPPGLELAVLDDGCGMDPHLLRTAMRFGGSSRFGDRRGTGRFGMGLPNASLSQARRVEVTSWQRVGAAQRTHLDVDEIAAGGVIEVPEPVATVMPAAARHQPQGTLVRWLQCDRLDNRRASTLTRKLLAGLGRMFRYALLDGVAIEVNGQSVRPIDPLYLEPGSVITGAAEFGEPLEFEFRAMTPEGPRPSIVTVRFSELPVHEWGKLSNEEKRKLGISKGAGVSVVRAGREVDYGWHLLGDKRKENYDDWWRCEIRFEPVLDELFGITHTKQQIRPTEDLTKELATVLEEQARALNHRAREAHRRLKLAPEPSKAERIATTRERALTPLPEERPHTPPEQVKRVQKQDPRLREGGDSAPSTRLTYRIGEGAPLDAQCFFHLVDEPGKLSLVINPHHAFFGRVYKSLQERSAGGDAEALTALELVLLAAIRAEAGMSPGDREVVTRFKVAWSNALAAFLEA